MDKRCDKCKYYTRTDIERLEWCKVLGIGVEPSFYCAHWENNLPRLEIDRGDIVCGRSDFIVFRDGCTELSCKLDYNVVTVIRWINSQVIPYLVKE